MVVAGTKAKGRSSSSSSSHVDALPLPALNALQARQYRWYLYGEVPTSHLEWAARRRAIIDELTAHAPDVVCLQVSEMQVSSCMRVRLCVCVCVLEEEGEVGDETWPLSNTPQLLPAASPAILEPSQMTQCL